MVPRSEILRPLLDEGFFYKRGEICLRIPAVDYVGLLFMGIAAILVYGAKWIMVNVFKLSEQQSFKYILAAKMAGLLIGILGMLKVIQIL